MSKLVIAKKSTSVAPPGSSPFFEKRTKADLHDASTFFTQQHVVPPVQTKLAMSKPDDALEQEADQMADQVQAKLAVGAPDDPFEQEADQMADKVVSQISSPSVQAKKEPSQRGRECEEGDQMFLKPASIQLLGEDIDSNGSRESVVAAARSKLGKIEAKHNQGGRRVGAEHLLEIFHRAAPGVWDDATIQNAGTKLPSWCGIFSVWAHKKAGKDVGNWQMGKGVTAFGTIQQTTNPLPGDIGYIDQPYQHHCIVVKVEGNNVHTIDGNSGLYSEVKENIRPRSAYTGFFTAFGGAGAVQKKDLLQRKTKGSGSTAPGSVEQSISATKGKGDSLPEHLQQSMGSVMGADFNDVKIHNDQHAAEMNRSLQAQAFTHGKDIYFNQGKYNPNSKDGQHLLAHELTHTIQQGSSAQRKLIQRNTNQPNQGTKKFPKFDEKNKTLDLEKINLPDFKKRNKDKFKTPLHSLQPRPKVESQDDKWHNFVQSAVNAKTADFLQDKQKTTDGVYFLKAKNSDFRLFGKLEQIQKESYIPKWNRFGKGNIHQVDHIVELQLGGDNMETNYELTDKLANTSSGNSIKIERMKRMDEAIAILGPQNPKLPARETLNKNYITTYDKVESWGLSYSGNGDVYWKMDEIRKGVHFEQLRQMTAAEIRESQGSDKEFVLYIRESSGRPMHIKLPFAGPLENWLPGIDLVSFNYKPGTADGQEFGDVELQLNKTFTRRMKANRKFKLKFNKTPYLINTGYLIFQKKDTGMEGILEFNGLSPVNIEEFTLDEKKGIVLDGHIITNIPIIDQTPIDFSLVGNDFTVSKEFTLEDIKGKFPKPLKVNDISLAVFASTKKGLGVQGLLDFEIENIGKGKLKGLGSSHDGFGIKGEFEFDPSLFKSKIEVSYIEKVFSVKGSATLEKGKLPGVKALNIEVGYSEEKITGKGKATLTIPGVKEIDVNIIQDPKTGLTIEGDVSLGDKLKSSANIKARVQNSGENWDVSIVGDINPNIDIAGLKINKVVISYQKGILDVAANAHFEKGKISGDIDLGVTNASVKPDGEKTEEAGKELAFYAKGELKLLITKGVETVLKIRITKEGDILIGGKLDISEDKYFIDAKKADAKSDKNLNIWDFQQKIPVASCGVASLVLKLKAGIGLFYEFDGLKLDKGTNVTMDEISLKNLSQAKLNSDISLSTGIKAGVDAYVGAEAGLEVLIAGFAGTGQIDLKLTAIEAKAKAKVTAGFSADEGLKFQEASMDFDVASKIGIQIVLGVRVYLNLLVTDVTLWSHEWKPNDLKGEKVFKWFDGQLKVPLKFGDNNSISIDDLSNSLKKEIGDKSKDESTIMRGVNRGVNDEGPTKEEMEEETRRNIKKDIKEAYRGAHSNEVFAFNSTINEDYFSRRVSAWNTVNGLVDLKPEIKELLQTEIKGYEFEEYEAFGRYLETETAFDADTKYLLIDEFIKYRPTLGSTELNNLRSLVVKPVKGKKPVSNKKSKPVQKKEIINNEHGHPVSDEFADNMQLAKAGGLPLPLDVRADMGRALGADFSQVRVHYDDAAAELSAEINAQAFTHENHIFFNQGKFDPASSEGKKLLAHELTHVLQQGHGDPVKRVAERDATGTLYTGNYIFDPGHDGLNSNFFSMVKRFVVDGTLSDNEIRVLRRDAITRNGTIMHAELLLMAAMRNPANIAPLQAHRGGHLIIPMNRILDADKHYITNFDRARLPADLEFPATRLLFAALGISGETIEEARNAMDSTAERTIIDMAGKQFRDHADKLIASLFTPPAISSIEVLTAMVNAASDSTPGDQIMAGIVYVIARRANHSMAQNILNGTLKVDAMIPSVYRRLLGGGEAGYSFSTDVDVRKANTLYIPTDKDILRLDHRALIIHELTHAEDDLTRNTEQNLDSLTLEARAYREQGKYMLDEIINNSPAPGFVNTASSFIDLGPLYYWSMLSAAKQNITRYQATFIQVASRAPSSRTQQSIQVDLALTDTAVNSNIRTALLDYRTPQGQQIYFAGNTRLGGNSGHYFQ